LARKARDCAEAYYAYAAQASPKIDTARAKKGRFRMETGYGAVCSRHLLLAQLRCLP